MTYVVNLMKPEIICSSIISLFCPYGVVLVIISTSLLPINLMELLATWRQAHIDRNIILEWDLGGNYLVNMGGKKQKDFKTES